MLLRWSLLLCLLAASCSSTPPVERQDELLVTINFYRSHNIGSKSAPTGVLRLADDRGGFEPLAWEELITNSVSVDESGRWIYLACGNGVMVSRDGGKSWFLTGGMAMAEVQRIWIDPENPRRAWAAGAYGLFHCEDILESNPWNRLEHDRVFRFCSDVRQDAEDSAGLWVASERGIVFVKHGLAVRRGAEVRTRRLLQDERDRQRWWATSDGLGLRESRDGGESWNTVPGSPDICLSVTRAPGESEILLVGAIDGFWRSDDLGGTWEHRSRGLPEGFFVLAIDVDPANGEHLVVAGSDGVFESFDGGGEWTRLGLEAALTCEARFISRAIVPELGPPEGVEAPRIPRGAPLEESRRVDPAFLARRRELLEHFVAKLPGPDAERIGIFPAILEAREEEPDPRLEEWLLTSFERPAHSMFFSLPAIGLYLHARDDLPAAARSRLEELLTTYSCYRGDTENHWVMHYTAMLLAAQTWPELPAEEWYMGRSSASLYAEAREWLVHWARLTSKRGQGEYDSPHYMFMFVTPMLFLYDFAEEPAMKQLAGMMLDLLLVDYLAESLQGAYCGGHSRAPSNVAVETTNNRATAYHWLYAGGIEKPEKIHGWLIAAALSSYVPPREFAGIANDRDETFSHAEQKRVRNVIRFGEELNPPVYKMNYMTPGYCLGSTPGGILQPIQQHTWDVTWLGGAPNSTLFTVHPSYAGSELGLFFPEEVHLLAASVASQKSTYTSPDKWISASPWERVWQIENTLLALYQVPPEWNFPHVDLHWPSCLQREERDGWWFGRDGNFFVAVRPTEEGTWIEEEANWRWRFDGAHLGVTVITAPWSEVGTSEERYAAFQEEVLACEPPALRGKGDELTLEFRTPGNHLLECVFGETLGRLNHHHPMHAREWLFHGPFVKAKRAGAARAGGQIRLSDGLTWRLLDFEKFQIETGVEE